jgi:hypothetical protein
MPPPPPAPGPAAGSSGKQSLSALASCSIFAPPDAGFWQRITLLDTHQPADADGHEQPSSDCSSAAGEVAATRANDGTANELSSEDDDSLVAGGGAAEDAGQADEEEHNEAEQDEEEDEEEEEEEEEQDAGDTGAGGRGGARGPSGLGQAAGWVRLQRRRGPSRAAADAGDDDLYGEHLSTTASTYLYESTDADAVERRWRGPRVTFVDAAAAADAEPGGPLPSRGDGGGGGRPQAAAAAAAAAAGAGGGGSSSNSNSRGRQFALWRAVLLSPREKFCSAAELQRRARQLGQGPQRWAVLMCRAGHFAGALLEDGVVAAHKTFHRYVVRAKQGGRQSEKGEGARSAGASLRRYNEAALDADIRALLVSGALSSFSCTRCICFD